MNCSYCRAQNDKDDARCNRCGRHFQDAARPRFITGNAAPALAAEPRIEVERPAVAQRRPSLAVVPPAVAPVEKVDGPGLQASLFGPQIVGGEAPPARKQPVQTRAKSERTPQSREHQAYFNFDAPTQSGAEMPSLHAPMAPTALRMISAGVDLFVALSGMAVFGATLAVTGAAPDSGSRTPLFYGAVAVVIVVFYRLLFCLNGLDTPGMKWTGLRLVNFDGHHPTREQRLRRLAGAGVGVIAAGLGILWALLDEHRLTWHDQISGTFATPDLTSPESRR